MKSPRGRPRAAGRRLEVGSVFDPKLRPKLVAALILVPAALWVHRPRPPKRPGVGWSVARLWGLVRAGDRAAVEALMARLVTEDPPDPRLGAGLMAVALEIGADAFVLREAPRFLAAAPEDPGLGIRYAVALRRVGRLDESAARLARLAARHPRHPWVALEAGATAAAAARWPEATRHYERAVALRPEAAAGYHGLAGARLARGDRAGAIAAYDELLRRFPRDRAGRAGRRKLGRGAPDAAGGRSPIKIRRAP